MYLLVRKTGGKYWRMNYRFDGKQVTLALGVYPDVSLATARKRRDEARQLLADGRDPREAKKPKRKTQFPPRSRVLPESGIVERWGILSGKRSPVKNSPRNGKPPLSCHRFKAYRYAQNP